MGRCSRECRHANREDLQMTNEEPQKEMSLP